MLRLPPGVPSRYGAAKTKAERSVAAADTAKAAFEEQQQLAAEVVEAARLAELELEQIERELDACDQESRGSQRVALVEAKKHASLAFVRLSKAAEVERIAVTEHRRLFEQAQHTAELDMGDVTTKAEEHAKVHDTAHDRDVAQNVEYRLSNLDDVEFSLTGEYRVPDSDD